MAFVAPLLPALGSFFGSAAGITATATAALGAVTAISEGNYQAAVARNNVKIAEQNAQRENLAAQTEAARLSQENAGRLADLTAAQAASGFSLGSRSFRQGRALETRIGAMETRDVARAGAERVGASFQEAANFRAQEGAARRGAVFGALGSVMSLGGEFARSPQAATLVKRSPLKKRFG